MMTPRCRPISKTFHGPCSRGGPNLAFMALSALSLALLAMALWLEAGRAKGLPGMDRPALCVMALDETIAAAHCR